MIAGVAGIGLRTLREMRMMSAVKAGAKKRAEDEKREEEKEEKEKKEKPKTDTSKVRLGARCN